MFNLTKYDQGQSSEIATHGLSFWLNLTVVLLLSLTLSGVVHASGFALEKLHLRTVGDSMLTEDEIEAGGIFKCPYTGVLFRGSNTQYLSDAMGDPVDTDQGYRTFLHEVKRGPFEGKVKITLPVPVDNDGRPVIVINDIPVDDSTFGPFPELQNLPGVKEPGRYLLRSLSLDGNAKNLKKKGGRWEASGILRKMKNIEVRCIFLVDTQLGRVTKCVGCHFFFQSKKNRKAESKNNS